MEHGTLRELVGGSETDRRIAETIEAATSGGDGRATTAGVQGGWNKSRFLANLEVAALQNNTWIENIGTFANKAKKLKGGYESEVYESKDGKSVIKINNLNFLNDDDVQYETTRDFNYFIDRLCFHNRLFPKDTYKLIGFSENTNGEFGIVLQQPFVQDAKLATPEQWDTHLTSRQFKKAKLTSLQGVVGYLDGEYELSDFKPENVLVDKNGDLRYIDLDISMVVVED